MTSRRCQATNKARRLQANGDWGLVTETDTIPVCIVFCVWVVQSNAAFRLLFFASSPCLNPVCLLSPSPTRCAPLTCGDLITARTFL